MPRGGAPGRPLTRETVIRLHRWVPVQAAALPADTPIMDGRVIPLPKARGLGNVAPPTHGSAEQISVLSVELKPVDADAPQLPRAIIERIHERCIRAALVVAGRRGGRLFLAGTSMHPVVDARFRGDGAAGRATQAAIEIAAAVADSQRSDESHLAPSIGIGVGEASMSPVGVRITRGSPARVAELLREVAGPSLVLFGGDGAAGPARQLGASVGESISIDPALPAVPVWRLELPEADDPGEPGTQDDAGID